MVATTESSTRTDNDGRSLRAFLESASWDSRLASCSPRDAERMRAGVDTLNKALAEGRPVYGVTQGYGPLVDFAASESVVEQGTGLISHLGTAQGEPLPPDVSRLVVWLRLRSMLQGYSAVLPERWERLAALWNEHFTPVIPRDGTVSASGDLQPLAHAALAHSGVGEAWLRDAEGVWRRRPAADALRELGAQPFEWPAREALAFVNGTSVGLARTMVNHQEVVRLVRAVAALTGRIVGMLGSNPQAYAAGIGLARGQSGQLNAARWIRDELPPDMEYDDSRPLQEPYSLRCAPQVLGAVLDQLDAIEPILVAEAGGCTDNPVSYEGEVLHGGNFHAMPVGLASDQIGLCLQQIAFLADRQLSLLCTPSSNGGLAPMLTPFPGRASGLAGVQLSATSFTSRIRQLVYPASLTALPTNGGNQDHVPMALNGANSVAEAVDLAWLVVGSLALGATQYSALTGAGLPAEGVWARIAEVSPPLELDRPLAADVRAARDLVRADAETRLAKGEL
ncbi:aromatic amino acid ammonia-lyase [Nocardiopsis dassonvillei]